MLIRCDRCGAPLDVKESQRTVTCSYCRGSNRIKSTQTMAAVTPPNWTPPPTWTPPPHISLAPLIYKPVAKVMRSILILFAMTATLGILGTIAVAILIGAITRPDAVLSFASRIHPEAAPAMGVVDLGAMPAGVLDRPGIAGGPVSASTVHSHCRGNVSEAPTVLLRVSAPQQLSVTTRGNADLTMVLRRSDSAFLCDDDSGEGLNPLITAGLAPGLYPVWIGTYHSNGSEPFTLHLESQTLTAMPLANVVAPGSAAAPGVSVRLANNLAPNSPPTLGTLDATTLSRPDTRSGTVTGHNDARNVWHLCRGALTPAPQLTVTTATARRLRFAVRSARPTSLLVLDANGTGACDDGSGGTRGPRIDHEFQPGTYQVWVGTTAPGVTANFRLTVDSPRGR